ncbi:MAG: LacI family DNA-binding transcriptional regulator, partial [Trueperaceae bacterium]|nr:LacI family DNA-binding transcriptional regulator [Trueperaceae bacterium]
MPNDQDVPADTAGASAPRPTRGLARAKRATLKEVAQAAGVSVGMASRVLGDYGSFSARTKEKVLAAARALEYRPNAVARSLRVGRTKAIGVVVANIASYHWITFVRGVEAAAGRHGYQVILGHTADDPAREREHIRSLYQRNVDGLIIAPMPENEERIRDLVEAGFPIVLTESTMERVATPKINIDDHRAAFEATTHLLNLGHRRVGFVAGDRALSSGRDRLQGYLDALVARGVAVDEDLIGHGEYHFDEAFAETDRLMALARPPTALLVANETMLGATLQCLKERRVRIPDDVSLIGFDDPPWAAFFTPAITTIRTPRDRMGGMAVQILIAMADAREGQAREVGE